jgi:CMP-N-acetylneuraminic acid synthetase
MSTHCLAVILARAGSKGLPGKNTMSVADRPMISYTIEQARASRKVDAICVTTDAPEAAEVARELGAFVVDRPAELATDTATVDAAARHAVEVYEASRREVTHVALLYANVPVRPSGIIDRAISHLIRTGAHSVRSLAPVTKQHPDWLHRVEGDRMVQFRTNSIYRRQDLEPLYFHDGAVIAVTRQSLAVTNPDDHHAFLGTDRRGIVREGGFTIDVDSVADLQMAEAVIRNQQRREPERQFIPSGVNAR